jgi:hypothetical protein
MTHPGHVRWHGIEVPGPDVLKPHKRIMAGMAPLVFELSSQQGRAGVATPDGQGPARGAGAKG